MSLVRIRSGGGNGREFLASEATLNCCPYFEAKLNRWSIGSGITVELDMDDESVAVILNLLRYGPAAVPTLPGSLQAKVLKDADYLGVPREKWGHLTAEKTSRERRRNWEDGLRFEHCPQCSEYTVIRIWQCVGCKDVVTDVHDKINGEYPRKWIKTCGCKTCEVSLAKSIPLCLVCG